MLAHQQIEAAQQAKQLAEENVRAEQQYMELAQQKHNAEIHLRDMQRTLLDAERHSLEESEDELAVETENSARTMAIAVARPHESVVQLARVLPACAPPPHKHEEQPAPSATLESNAVQEQQGRAKIETEKLLGKLRRIGQRSVLAQTVWFASIMYGLVMLLPSLLPSAMAMGNVHPNTQPTDATHSAARGEVNATGSDAHR
jgi:hypothetical protein